MEKHKSRQHGEHRDSSTPACTAIVPFAAHGAPPALQSLTIRDDVTKLILGNRYGPFDAPALYGPLVALLKYLSHGPAASEPHIRQLFEFVLDDEGSSHFISMEHEAKLSGLSRWLANSLSICGGGLVRFCENMNKRLMELALYRAAAKLILTHEGACYDETPLPLS